MYMWQFDQKGLNKSQVSNPSPANEKTKESTGAKQTPSAPIDNRKDDVSFQAERSTKNCSFATENDEFADLTNILINNGYIKQSVIEKITMDEHYLIEDTKFAHELKVFLMLIREYSLGQTI